MFIVECQGTDNLSPERKKNALRNADVSNGHRAKLNSKTYKKGLSASQYQESLRKRLWKVLSGNYVSIDKSFQWLVQAKSRSIKQGTVSIQEIGIY